jgi:hypothetical protein
MLVYFRMGDQKPDVTAVPGVYAIDDLFLIEHLIQEVSGRFNSAPDDVVKINLRLMTRNRDVMLDRQTLP